MQRFIAIVVLVVAGPIAGSSPDLFELAVLSPSEAAALAKQCSRPGPPPFDGTWTPTRAQVSALKVHLPGLVGMKATGCCLQERSIKTLSNVRVQVVGLVLVGGKRVFYLNGLSGMEGEESWRTKADVVCDGGDAFWGVIFDPATDAFSDLAFNGSV